MIDTNPVMYFPSTAVCEIDFSSITWISFETEFISLYFELISMHLKFF